MKRGKTDRTWVRIDVTDAVKPFLERGISLRRAKQRIAAILEIEALAIVDWDKMAEQMANERRGKCKAGKVRSTKQLWWEV